MATRPAFFGVFLLVALQALACPNDCSFKGTCNINNQCECYAGFTDADCSRRLCPKGPAWHGISLVVAGSREWVECSGRGVCDRTIGMCDCFPGYASSNGTLDGTLDGGWQSAPAAFQPPKSKRGAKSCCGFLVTDRLLLLRPPGGRGDSDPARLHGLTALGGGGESPGGGGHQLGGAYLATPLLPHPAFEPVLVGKQKEVEEGEEEDRTVSGSLSHSPPVRAHTHRQAGWKAGRGAGGERETPKKKGRRWTRGGYNKSLKSLCP